MSFTIQQSITEQIIKTLMKSVQKQIKICELIKKMPQFLQQEMLALVKQQMNSMTQQHEGQNLKGMGQQKAEQVKALKKDTLMPKQLVLENEEIDKVEMDKNFSLKGSKRFSNLRGTRNSLKRKTMSGISAMNQSSRTQKFSMPGSKIKRKQKEDNFIELNFEEHVDDDPQLKSIRKIKQFQQRQLQKQIKQKNRRDKVLEQKRQQFEQKYKQKQYTFDFQGNTIDFHQIDGNIQYHSIKSKFTNVEKHNRTNLNKIRDRNEPQQIVIKKKFNKKSQEIQRFEATLQVPTFNIDQSQKRSSFGLPVQVSKYHLKDYKKHYGGKFNRLQKSLNTIDIINREKTPKQYDDLFTSRRYLKDQASQVLNQSITSQRSRQAHPRRLALPKLKGKYSTLDRYSQN